ncbi:hypothetical protein LIER_38794 [Lithospermum erythrorhizon]|uniref:Reverse transcriptase domain-containing protein n=1 Tax=Lithospermum erythrorhizon TaxID=34254 RepID=A0AAV3Q826_LITER
MEFSRGDYEETGFYKISIDWVMCIVSSVSYSFLLNIAPKGFLRPSRGIRQGDPLCPYFFLLCAEGLTSMLRMAETRGALTAVKINRGRPSVSYILFADDIFVFCRATVKEVEVVMQNLEDYELASGQKVNVEKSSVSFECRMVGDTKEAVMRILRMKEVQDQGKYLGLPSHIGRTKSSKYGLRNALREMPKYDGGLGFKDLECMNLALLARQG